MITNTEQIFVSMSSNRIEWMNEMNQCVKTWLIIYIYIGSSLQCLQIYLVHFIIKFILYVFGFFIFFVLFVINRIFLLMRIFFYFNFMKLKQQFGLYFIRIAIYTFLICFFSPSNIPPLYPWHWHCLLIIHNNNNNNYYYYFY